MEKTKEIEELIEQRKQLDEKIKKLEQEQKDSITVCSHRITRSLLKAGHQIVDIKPDKSDKKKTVHVFKNDDLFMQDYNKLREEIAKERKNFESYN